LLEDAIEFARLHSEKQNISWRVADFNEINTEHDISICSLVCHHFYGKVLVDFIYKMSNTAKLGVVINDLHRHWFAFHSIGLLSRIFSKSHLVKNDAKLSVLKGFKIAEWRHFLSQLGFKNYSIRWIWAFRHLIILRK